MGRANILGPILGGVLYGIWGITSILILSSVCFFLSVVDCNACGRDSDIWDVGENIWVRAGRLSPAVRLWQRRL